jgi:hypothetical protein
MDLNTLLTFIVGAFAALIPVIVTNRHQAKEREKDRLEQRREAKIQAREKWMERDILKIMDYVDTMVMMLSESRNLGLERSNILEQIENPLFTEDNIKSQAKLNFQRFLEVTFESNKTFDMMGKLALSFHDKSIDDGYFEFMDHVIKSFAVRDELNKNPASEKFRKDEIAAWGEVRFSAGKFHWILREKLIALRE